MCMGAAVLSIAKVQVSCTLVPVTAIICQCVVLEVACALWRVWGPVWSSICAEHLQLMARGRR